MPDKTLSFIRSLCFGEIVDDIIFPFPTMKAEEESLLKDVLGAIDDLLKDREPDFRAWDAAGEMPAEFIEELKGFGLFGLIIDEDHGGMGMGNMAYSRTLQQVARYDASVAVTIGAHSSIGMRGLKLFGTQAQKDRYYPKLATGEMIAAFCLTEPGAGSDAASVRMTAEDKGDHYLLNGSKIWITNGGIADFFTVFAKTGEKEGRARLTAFIVTRDLEGVSSGPHEDKMGIRASSTTTVYLDNVKVPKENILGEVHGGFKVAMNILNSGRSGLGGGCVGGMKKLIAEASRFAMERKQFGQPIGDFGLIKQKIGQMVVDCYAAEAAVTIVAALADQGYEDYSVEAAISKVFNTEALWKVADEALQVAGGGGFMRELPYERVVRDSRVNRIFEGTNEVLRLYIALTAMGDVGQELKSMAKVKGLFDDPIKGFGVLYGYARRRAQWAAGYQNPAWGMKRCHLLLRPQAEIFEQLTLSLGQMVDRMLRKHGKNIIGKQFASKRLADVMIDLFVLAAVLSRVTAAIEAKGEDGAAEELHIARVFGGQVHTRVMEKFRRIDDNDDEPIKALAEAAYGRAGYGWDTVS